MIFGGGDGDTAVFAGVFSDFEIAYDAAADRFVVVDRNAADGLDEGRDLVSGVNVFSFAGVERSAASLKPAMIEGTSGDDNLAGTGAADLMAGRGGNDQVNGNEGDDTLYGGDGNDVLAGGGGADRLFGDAGDDTLYANAGDDRLDGGAGADRLWGEAGDDVLTGGEGWDADVMHGQDGADAFDVWALQGDDAVYGGGGGWTDVLRVHEGGGAAAVGAASIAGDGWTLTLDPGHSVVASGDGQATFSGEAAGVISFDRGGSVVFQGIEHLTW